jgi:hypothetical protein
MSAQCDCVFPTNFGLMVSMPSGVGYLTMHAMQMNRMLSVAADPAKFCATKCRVSIFPLRIERTIVDEPTVPGAVAKMKVANP